MNHYSNGSVLRDLDRCGLCGGALFEKSNKWEIPSLLQEEQNMESVHENRVRENVARKADHYWKKYKPQMELLENSALAKARNITAYDHYALGGQLENFDGYIEFCEEDGVLSNLGKLPDIAYDVLTVQYGSSPLAVVANFQPIDEENGTVYFRQVVADTTRGTVTASDVLAGPRNAPDSHPRSFASGYVRDAVIEAATTYGTQTYSATMTILPIRPFTVTVTLYESNGTTVVASGTDDGAGLIRGYDLQGTVNYTTGVFSIELYDDPGNNRIIRTSYHQDLEAAADITQIAPKMVSRSVFAHIYALKDTIGLMATYALRKRFGEIAEDMISQDLVSMLNAELMNEAVWHLTQNIPAANTHNWSYTPDSGVSRFEHRQEIKGQIARAETNMLSSAGHGAVNVIVAGNNWCALFQQLPGWTKISDGRMLGPHIAGTLDGMTIVRVPATAVLNANHAYCIYKGPNPFEGALTYCPYMPLVVTTALPTGANPLLNQKAAAVWSAIDPTVPNFITRIVLQNYA